MPENNTHRNDRGNLTYANQQIRELHERSLKISLTEVLIGS